MPPEQFEALQRLIKEEIKEGIDTNVNGKINNLKKTVDDYILLDTAWKENDKEWKERAQPAIDLGDNMRGFGKIFGYIVAGVTGMGIMIKLLLPFIDKK